MSFDQPAQRPTLIGAADNRGLIAPAIGDFPALGIIPAVAQRFAQERSQPASAPAHAFENRAKLQRLHRLSRGRAKSQRHAGFFNSILSRSVSASEWPPERQVPPIGTSSAATGQSPFDLGVCVFTVPRRTTTVSSRIKLHLPRSQRVL